MQKPENPQGFESRGNTIGTEPRRQQEAGLDEAWISARHLTFWNTKDNSANVWQRR
jgi:hypothetical protein